MKSAADRLIGGAVEELREPNSRVRVRRWPIYFLAMLAAAVIYFGGLSGLIIGVSIALYLAITMTVLPKLQMAEEKLQAIEKRVQPADEFDEEEFSFSLPDPAPDGWEEYTVYPLRKCYERQYCFGGPPTHNETWEYDVKGSQVVHRLRDANEEYFDDPVFEVINGTVGEEGVAENSSADYVSKRVERHRQSVQWHECRGSVSFEILAIHFRSQSSRVRGILARKQQKLKAGFAEMEKKLVALGAIEEDDPRGVSYFTAPKGASENVQKEIDHIQNNTWPKSLYSDSSRITFLEFARRNTILATLDRLLSQVPQHGTKTTE